MTTLHGSAVAIDGRGVLITGPSGSGKSALAAELIARGGVLIADDRVRVLPGTPPLLTAPDEIAGLIELWGLGILRFSETTEAPASLIVDLSPKTRERLPDLSERVLLGAPIRLIYGDDLPTLAAAVMLALKGAFLDPKIHKIE